MRHRIGTRNCLSKGTILNAGASSGFMIAQYTALGLVSENRRLAAPSSRDGGVSAGLQEDEIPHSTTGALRVLTIVDNLETILVIELLAAAQCYEFQDPRLARARRPMRYTARCGSLLCRMRMNGHSPRTLRRRPISCGGELASHRRADKRPL
jgi:histidine ammonia-lyase